VDLRTGLDEVEKSKFFTLPGLELQPLGRPACSSRYTGYVVAALIPKVTWEEAANHKKFLQE
jgi:hypothetical protein